MRLFLKVVTQILEKALGKQNIITPSLVPAGEDFAFYQEKIPGVFIFLGITPRGQDPSKIALNHSPYFFIDESGLFKVLKHYLIWLMDG
jgi:metal-dependent amidase/aminoacylase/carboxypeptidase family protein